MWALRHLGSVVEVLGFSCPWACGIFVPDQGLNLHPLHWKADSYPLGHQGSPLYSLTAHYYVPIALLAPAPHIPAGSFFFLTTGGFIIITDMICLYQTTGLTAI